MIFTLHQKPELLFQYLLREEGVLPSALCAIEPNLLTKEGVDFVQKYKQAVQEARDFLLEKQRFLSLVEGKYKEKYGKLSFIFESQFCEKINTQVVFGEGIEKQVSSFQKGWFRLLKEILDKNHRLFLNECSFQAFEKIKEGQMVKVLSHRARGFGQDEASLSSLKKVLKLQVRELEFDLRMSRDKMPMITHNLSLGELAHKREKISDLSSESLCGLDLKNGEKLTTLRIFFEEVSRCKNDRTKFNLDIKDFDPDFLESILALIAEFKMEGRVQIMSWMPQILQYLYEKNPWIEYCFSYHPTMGIFSQKSFKFLPSFQKLYVSIFRSRRTQKEAEEIAMAAQEFSEKIYYKDVPWDLKSGVGTHPFSLAPGPSEMRFMPFVLASGSVNIFYYWGLENHKSFYKFKVSCEDLGIKINFFDIRSLRKIKSLFRKHPSLGPVFTSNPKAVYILSPLS